MLQLESLFSFQERPEIHLSDLVPATLLLLQKYTRQARGMGPNVTLPWRVDELGKCPVKKIAPIVGPRLNVTDIDQGYSYHLNYIIFA